MKQFTDITILLDRSGSMATIKSAMEEALNGFVKEHASVPTTKVTLIQFNDVNDQDVIFQSVPVEAVEPIHIRPFGSTPLIDAFVKAIDRTGSRYASLDESERPDQVLFVVITDGQENASRTYRRNDVSSRVAKQHADYKWQFVYLGANQDAISEAANYGIRQDWALTYLPTLGSTAKAANFLSSNTVAYANRSRGAGAAVQSFTDAQRLAVVDDSSSTLSIGEKIDQTAKKLKR